MQTEKKVEERLWEYMDGLATEQEKNIIEKLIATDIAWKEKYNDLLELQQLIHSTDLEEPSMRFTKNVMDEIAKVHIAPATKSYLNKNIIRGIAAVFIGMLVFIFFYAFVQIDWQAGSSTAVPVKLKNFDYNSIFSSISINALIMINIILGLFLLDRYLATKKKNYKAQAR